MTTFLTHVADNLLRRFGSDMHHVCIVCPGKRVRLFLEKELLSRHDGGAPLWAPRFCTIEEMFQRLGGGLVVCDRLEAVCWLWHVYREQFALLAAPDAAEAEEETLDTFYAWGERLLEDFSDIDKCLVDAEALFANAHDLAHLSTVEHLTSRQREALEAFFHTAIPERDTEMRRKFAALWERLPYIYNGVRATLSAQGLAYEGMLMREVAEHAEERVAELRDFDATCFAFLGFNILTKAERRLLAAFHHLKGGEKHGALFYWDFDEYFTTGSNASEAGASIRQNVTEFGNALADTPTAQSFAQPKEVRIISASTDTAAANFLTQELTEQDNAATTAIVLCDEQGVVPILHALPPCITKQNLTKGFPLGHTHVFATLCAQPFFDSVRSRLTVDETMAALQQFVAEERERLLEEVKPEGTQEKLEGTCEKLKGTQEKLESTCEKPEGTRGNAARKAGVPEGIKLEREALFFLHTRIQRLSDVRRKRLPGTGEPLLDVSNVVFLRLLRALLRQSAVPMQGEPLEGLQIMGLLETRCLDFDRVFLLSANEGKLPPSASTGSIIPYFLRRAYGLTLPEDRAAVHAYNFYRLLSRASHIDILYTTGAVGGEKPEVSRFVHQLLVEDRTPTHTYRRLALESAATTAGRSMAFVHMPEDFLETSAERPLSPSAINSFIDCPLSFYYRYVLHVRERIWEATSLESNYFGSIVHTAAQCFYERVLRLRADGRPRAEDFSAFIGKDGQRNALLGLIRQGKERVDAEEWQRNDDGSRLTHPFDAVSRNIAADFLHDLLLFDRMQQPEVLACELDVAYPIAFTDHEGNERRRLVGGRIDRLDILHTADGKRVLRVVDYKTGSRKHEKGSLEDCFTWRRNRPSYLLQTLVYCHVLRQILSHPRSAEYEALQEQLRRQNPHRSAPLTLSDFDCIQPCLIFLPELGAFRGAPSDEMRRKGETQFLVGISPSPSAMGEEAAATSGKKKKTTATPLTDFAAVEAELTERLADKLRTIHNPLLPIGITNQPADCSPFCPYWELCFHEQKRKTFD